MGQNRMEQLLRCPTLEQPSLEYFEVRLPLQSFAVGRETAERVLEAVLGFEPVEWVRLETVGGSMAWVRTAHVMSVREWSSAQRESERRFWKQIDAEDEEDDKASAGSEEQEGQPEVEASPEGVETEASVAEGSERSASERGSGRVSLATIVLTLWITWLALTVLRAVAGS